MATSIRKTHFILALVASWIDSFKRVVAAGGAGGAVSGTSASTTPGAGGSTTPSFTGTAPTAAVTDLVTGTGYSTVGQVVTTTESFTAALNLYAGCWLLPAAGTPCQIVSHPAVSGAPLVFTTYGAAPATDAGGFKILRAPTPAGAVGAHTHTGAAHTHGAGSFASSPASSTVHYDRGEYTVGTANATTLNTSIALCKALLTAYAAHIADALAHDAVDTVNDGPPAVSTVINLATAITAANALKTAYNAHRSEAGVHKIDDAGNAVSSADATDQSSLNTLLNEVKGDFNAHIADGIAAPSWRMTDA